MFYPIVCAGCGSDALSRESQLCAKCIHELPTTEFEHHAQNPVEKMFTGRIQYEKASAQFYFTKKSALQNLMHQFKYRGNKALGKQLGIIMGVQLLESRRFNDIDALVPLPLFENKERKRGYNQSKILCEGIREIMNIDIINDAIERPLFTETQTKKNRIERWKNMEGKFNLKAGNKISGKHLLIIDDVITTGATIESCANTLHEANNVKISIASLCFASSG
jgi:ComF family protein